MNFEMINMIIELAYKQLFEENGVGRFHAKSTSSKLRKNSLEQQLGLCSVETRKNQSLILSKYLAIKPSHLVEKNLKFIF